MPNLARSLLHLRLAPGRFDTGALLAGACALGAAALWFGLLPGMSARIDQQARAVARARSAPAPARVVPPAALAAQRLADFHGVLGNAGRTDEIVTRLFEAAAQTGVALNKAEYRPAHDAAGRYDTYTIVLPVKGDYASVRRFCEQVLLTLPYLALDDMRFKRSSANDRSIEASLRFTAFLRADVPASTPTAPGEVRQ
ncbi:hypothetical protein [Trinickia terrae]|nr:hypothetical protein [Trinickia terrae]